MKRWGLCKMIPVDGGTEPAISFHTGVAWRIIHFGNPNWGLMQFATNNLTPISADGDCYVLPDLTYDFVPGPCGPARG